MADSTVPTRPKNFINRVGQRFGRLVVTEVSHTRNGSTYWKCVCDCGGERVARSHALTRGATKSCGCLARETLDRGRNDYENRYLDNGDGTTSIQIIRKSNAELLGVVTIDTADRPTIEAKQWHFNRKGYAAMGSGHRVRAMHSLIGGVGCDHKDLDKRNNRRSNLRPATTLQNCWNRPKRKDSRWRFKGICKSKNRWMAQITVRGRTIFLGMFGTDVDAAKAYDAAARKYFGEFACCNFPPNEPVLSIPERDQHQAG